MSIVGFVNQAQSSVNREVLSDVAAKNNITLPSPAHEDAYLQILQSTDVVVSSVDELPDYVDPRLAQLPVKNTPRKYHKPINNDLNAWSYQTILEAESPSSDILSGRRIILKDNMSVSGLPFTNGMTSDAHESGEYPVATIDATVTRRILEAGGTIVGTATCENYCLNPLSYSSANGPVHNPWLRNHNAGGSTSGGTCLVALQNARAAGVPGLDSAGSDADIAMGGDQGGSIRIPAALCGIYGLKPTHGLIPYTGIAGAHPMVDHTGPIARNLDDIAIILTVLAGYDGLDPRMTPDSPQRENVRPYHVELAAVPPSESANLRVGIISESLKSPGMQPAVVRIVQSAAETHFASAGASVSHVSIPLHRFGPAIWTAATRSSLASLGLMGRPPDLLDHGLPHFAPRWPPDQEFYRSLTHHNPAVIGVLFGETFLNSKYGPEVQAKARRHVLQLRAAYDKALEQFDVLVTPTTSMVAPPHPDMRAEDDGGSSVMDKIKLGVGVTNNTCPFNITGHPALNVPCGWARSRDDSGWLPVGLQIIGKRWDDMGVLKAARIFEWGGGGLGPWPGKTGQQTG